MTIATMAVLLLAAQDAAEYFPLKAGMKWTYKLGDGKEVVKAVQDGGKVSNLGDWGVFKDPAVVASTKEGIALQQLSKSAMNLVWLKTPVKVGVKWSSKTNLGDVPVKFESSVDAEEEIEVPAGKFKCVRVKTAFGDGEGTAGELRSWYARGVGEVQSIFTVESGRRKDEIVRKLVKFEEPGK